MQPKKIQCHCLPAYGHAIPMLRIIQILQDHLPNIQISFISSQFFVDRMKSLYPHITMISVKDGLTQADYFSLKHKYGMRLLGKFYFKMHRDYFFHKKDHPDLLICDIFSEQALRYAKLHNIPCIINSIFSYHIFQEVYNIQKLERSFSIGGFTIMYPHPVNLFYIVMGFDSMYEVCRDQYKILINSAVGLEHGTTVPTHHTFIGLLTGKKQQKKPLSQELIKWMAEWKEKGKQKFLYISFGTEINLSQNFVLKLKKTVEKIEIPTIWSLKDDFGKVQCPLIFHRKWLPQASILGLPEVTGFVSHCGWGSTCEAVMTGTPIIGIPCFGDQIYNASLIDSMKMGLKIYESLILGAVAPKYFNPWISEQKIASSILEVMHKDVFRQNILRVGKICSSYRTEELVIQAVTSSLEFGNQYLIDKKFEKAASRSTTDTVKLVAIMILFIFVWKNWDSLGQTS